MKIVVLDGYTENPGDLSWEALGKLGNLTVYDRTEKEDIVTRIADAEAVYTNKTPITEETLAQCRHLRYIGVLATGYNVVDVKAAKEKGIVVTNIPTYGTAAVGQFAIALLLEICHHIGHHSEAVQKGRWAQNADWCFWDYPLIELAGKKMGIIGFGRIGRTTAQIAQALGMKVLAYDAVKPDAVPDRAGYTIDYGRPASTVGGKQSEPSYGKCGKLPSCQCRRTDGTGGGNVGRETPSGCGFNCNRLRAGELKSRVGLRGKTGLYDNGMENGLYCRKGDREAFGDASPTVGPIL